MKPTSQEQRIKELEDQVKALTRIINKDKILLQESIQPFSVKKRPIEVKAIRYSKNIPAIKRYFKDIDLEEKDGKVYIQTLE